MTYLPTPTVFTSTYETVQFGIVCTDVTSVFSQFVYLANTYNILNITLIVIFVIAAVYWLRGRLARRAASRYHTEA